LAVLLSSVSWAGFAQDADQAYNLSENFYIGSARTLAMGNAFTAVGGDLGAISINPASSGVLRLSEFEISPAVIRATGNTEYLNSFNSGSFSKFTLPSVAYSQNVPTGNLSGLVSVNFGVSFNRVKSFNSVVNVSGLMKAGRGDNSSSWAAEKACTLLNYDSAYYGDYSSGIPWAAQLAWDSYLVEDVDGILLGATENYDYESDTPYLGGDIFQNLYRKTTGGIDELSINFAGNWNDNFYFGVNLNIYDVDYTVNDTYSEEALSSLDFETGIIDFTYDYWQRTVGAGIGLKAGIIYLPTQHLRIGATISTPTLYSLTDYWGSSLYNKFDNGNRNYCKSPDGTFDYRVTTPMRYSFGVAYTLGTSGIVSFDYEGVNYSKILMKNDYGNTAEFSGDNTYIRNNYMRNASIFRAGLEWNLGSSLALRGGYSYYDDGRPGYDGNHFVSCGLGFRLSKGAFLDFAWQRQCKNENVFTLYDDYENYKAPVGYVTNRNNKILATLRFKF